MSSGSRLAIFHFRSASFNSNIERGRGRGLPPRHYDKIRRRRRRQTFGAFWTSPAAGGQEGARSG